MNVEKEGHIYHVQLAASDSVKPCPFCGGYPALVNTWTASYWLECRSCGAEMHDQGNSGSPESKVVHLKSARRVVKQWNERYEYQIT